MRVVLSAGEASGDAYAGAILKELRRMRTDAVDASGIGGRRLAAEGARLVGDSSRWGAMGITESIRVIPRVYRSFHAMKAHLRSGEPGLFIPIDYGFVNLKLAQHAKHHGWRVLYFSPPGAWRRDRQGADLPGVADAIVTPFPWSAEILKRMGANAHWFGHPIKQLLREAPFDTSSQRERIAVLPGSRDPELRLNIPVIAGALEAEPRIAEFAVAPNLDSQDVSDLWARFAPSRCDDVFTQSDTYGVLRRARVGIVCSGTATIEAALCRCPHVVIYRVSKLAELEARLVRLRLEFISQPNLILQREVVPELVQHSVTAENIRRHLEPLLAESEERAKQLAAFDEIDAMLGSDDAITRTAELAAQMVAGG